MLYLFSISINYWFLNLVWYFMCVCVFMFMCVVMFWCLYNYLLACLFLYHKIYHLESNPYFVTNYKLISLLIEATECKMLVLMIDLLRMHMRGKRFSYYFGSITPVLDNLRNLIKVKWKDRFATFIIWPSFDSIRTNYYFQKKVCFSPCEEK